MQKFYEFDSAKKHLDEITEENGLIFVERTSLEPACAGFSYRCREDEAIKIEFFIGPKNNGTGEWFIEAYEGQRLNSRLENLGEKEIILTGNRVYTILKTKIA